MHTTLHPLAMAGLALIAVALLIYLVAIIAAMLRMRRQYSSAMSGLGSLRLGAAFSAAARLWPLAIVILIGVGLVVAGR